MNLKPIGFALLQLFSLVLSGYLILTIFAAYTEIIGWVTIFLSVLVLAFSVVFRYSILFHHFSQSTYRTIAAVLSGIGVFVMGSLTIQRFISEFSFEEILIVFDDSTLRIGTTAVLPEGWIVAFLVTAGVLILSGTLMTRDRSPYPKPKGLSAVASSPVYFGIACSFFGLWSVLFVGLSFQRIIIFAPIFEELLKFGVALLIGSVLFGRSIAARVGVAVVVGSLFGIVEHATTYSTEPDTVYLFRTLFHTVTTVLSVSVYTMFESMGEDRMCWIAPSYSIILHFLYNTFVVLSAIIGIVVFGNQSTTIPLVYGSAAILVATCLFILVFLSKKVVVAAHRPLENLLSDLI